MFGWIRKLTQRSAVEESSTPSPSIAPEASAAIPAARQVPPPAEAFARPARQQPAEQQLVDVYTPEPMPEPPTFAPPELDSAKASGLAGAHDSAALEAKAPAAELPNEPAPTPQSESSESSETRTHTAESPETRTHAAVAPDAAPAAESGPAELEDSPLDAQFEGLLAAPSPRPAMPLSAHPNFAGLGLAEWEPIAPRLLEPEAALTPEAQEELLKLFDDLFGPRGRYRLEWRTERQPGDDAMFAEIMTADIVRRVQNTIADVAQLERPTPPRAIEAAFADREAEEITAPEAATGEGEAFRRAS